MSTSITPCLYISLNRFRCVDSFHFVPKLMSCQTTVSDGDLWYDTTTQEQQGDLSIFLVPVPTRTPVSLSRPKCTSTNPYDTQYDLTVPFVTHVHF